MSSVHNLSVLRSRAGSERILNKWSASRTVTVALPKFTPKTIQHQLGSGLATGIFGDAGNVQADPLSLLVPEKVVPALFEGLTPRGPASRFLLNFQPSIDVIGKKTRPTLLGREMPWMRWIVYPWATAWTNSGVHQVPRSIRSASE